MPQGKAGSIPNEGRKGKDVIDTSTQGSPKIENPMPTMPAGEIQRSTYRGSNSSSGKSSGMNKY